LKIGIIGCGRVMNFSGHLGAEKRHSQTRDLNSYLFFKEIFGLTIRRQRVCMRVV
jgi:hypothetical protein